MLISNEFTKFHLMSKLIEDILDVDELNKSSYSDKFAVSANLFKIF